MSIKGASNDFNIFFESDFPKYFNGKGEKYDNINL